jgi:FG-GAP-like repeat/Cep192 domain 4/HYDIN/CFA65/VesB-like, Ig-like domain
MRTLRFVGTAKIIAVLAFVFFISAAGFGQEPPPVSFIARRDYSLGTALGSSQILATGDLNADGNLDLVAVLNGGGVSVLLGNADGTFPSPLNYSTAINVGFIQLVDLNGDGKLDVLLASQSTQTVSITTVSVLLGNGDGTFQPESLITISNSNCRCLATGDFNDDGKLDLAFPVAVPQVGDSAMNVMLGNGDGTFQPQIVANAGPFPTGVVAAGDFNNDGILDLVSVSASISVFLGNGDGTFQNPVNTAANLGNDAFVVADFTGDGILDIGWGGAVFPGNGDGTFQPAIISTSACGPALYTADLNGDGKPDLVCNEQGGSGIFGGSVLLGNGDGTFQVLINANLPIDGVAFGDFNHDGKLDMAASTGDGGVVGVVSTAFGNEDGTFQLDASVSAGSSLAADFTGDGNVDKLEFSVNVGLLFASYSLLPGNGDGTFQASVGGTQINACIDGPGCRAVVYDFNNDGRLDFAATSFNGTGLSSSTLGIFLGKGDGTFQAEVDYNGGGTSIAVGDFNEDGNIDLVTGGRTANSVSILFGKGDGTFGFPTAVPVSGPANFVTTGDFNNDGHLDLAVATVVGTLSTIAILPGSGTGTFGPETNFVVSSDSSAPVTNLLAAADFNTDGKVDLVTGSTVGSTVSVLLNTGSGFSITTYPVIGTVNDVEVADFNGDGIPDIAILNSNSEYAADLSILVGNGDGTFQPAVNFGAAPGGFQFGIADVNRDGSPDIVEGPAILLNQVTGPAASIAPSLADFGNAAIGSVNGPQTITLTNTGKLTLTISSITLSGPQSSDFTQTNTCGSSLATGASCTFSVTFTPTAAGLRGGSIQIADNAFNSPQVINLRGTGVPSAPGVSLAPNSLDFASEAVGVVSAAQTVTLTNTGNASLSITGITITGAQASDYAQTNTCSSGLAAQTNCTVSVTFTAGAVGSRIASLTIADNAGSSTQTVVLSGSGTGGSLNLGTSSATQTVTAGQSASYTLSIGGRGFSGTVSLTCTGALTGAACSVPASEAVSATTVSNFTVSVTTTARSASAALAPSSFPRSGWLYAMALAGILILPASSKHRRKSLRFLRGFPILLLAFLCSCGGGSSNGGNGGGGSGGTAAGTYTFTVNATSGSMSQSLPLTLIVQ